AETADDGSFHFAAAAGSCDLLARDPYRDGCSLAIRRGLQVPSTELVTLTPEAGAVLELEATETVEVAYEIVAAGLSIAQNKIKAGDSRTELVPAGDVMLRWTAAGHDQRPRSGSRMLSLAAGARASLRLE